MARWQHVEWLGLLSKGFGFTNYLISVYDATIEVCRPSEKTTEKKLHGKICFFTFMQTRDM